MYVEFLLLSFFITDNESFERPLVTPFRSMMMMMKQRELMTFVVFVCCVCASKIFFEEDEIFVVWRKKRKKDLHRAREKALFCSSVKVFFDEKVFKETRTNATLTTTLIKKEEKTER